jgi:hypothetical protein
MALDFMAIISNGTYPTPTPTAAQRAIYAVSFGMLSTAPEGEIGGDLVSTVLAIGKKAIGFARGLLRIG